MQRFGLCGAVALVGVFLASSVLAAEPTPAEMSTARQWVTARFEGQLPTGALEPGLRVLANNDRVQMNARAGKPLRIGDQQFTRGLYCHAVSKVVVQLPSPGKTFLATVGLDNNEQTACGAGSAVFSVSVGDRCAFQSDVVRLETPAIPMQVDLGGATELTLDISDAGNGIACDQADWADARVVLGNGQTVWLSDLPLTGPGSRKYDIAPFFSFNYDGQPSSEALKSWELTRTKRAIDVERVEHTLCYRDPKTGLVVRCVGVEYLDFPTVEWTVTFENTSDKETPILSDIQAIDITEEAQRGATEPMLHHHVGSPHQKNDYEPLETPLVKGSEKQIATCGGRGTYSNWPYFNVEQSTAEGMIVVVGWPGQWAASFQRDEADHLRIRAGQENTHFKLLPGETFRTPLMVVQFWSGDRLHSQNVWRDWMRAHNVPRPHGKLPPVQLAACSSHQFAEMCNANTESQIFFVDRYLEEGLKLDYWWMDAGWYPCDAVGWPKTGTWEVDTRRFPKGLREVSDHAHAKGVNIIVWFEPERCMADTWLTKTHPEWIIGGKDGGLLNLGNPEAWHWLVEHIDGLLVSQGIDLYRQDFNIDPLDFWRRLDAPDRQGITENKYVVGYLAYWDELRRRHPDMLIDSCASGGKRNDLETLRRAVPLLRSDYIMEPVGNQGHTYGMASWVPYFGTGGSAIDAYATRSVMCPAYNACIDMRKKDLNYAEARRLFASWRQFAQYMLDGDYYPLTKYSLDDDTWMAWQFDCPDKGEGVVQAFRHANSPYEAIRVRLHGLSPDAVYTLTNVDKDGTLEKTGRELVEQGLLLTAEKQPEALVILYAKKS